MPRRRKSSTQLPPSTARSSPSRSCRYRSQTHRQVQHIAQTHGTSTQRSKNDRSDHAFIPRKQIDFGEIDLRRPISPKSACLAAGNHRLDRTPVLARSSPSTSCRYRSRTHRKVQQVSQTHGTSTRRSRIYRSDQSSFPRSNIDFGEIDLLYFSAPHYFR
jgi:hypothetical protein